MKRLTRSFIALTFLLMPANTDACGPGSVSNENDNVTQAVTKNKVTVTKKNAHLKTQKPPTGMKLQRTTVVNRKSKTVEISYSFVPIGKTSLKAKVRQIIRGRGKPKGSPKFERQVAIGVRG